MSTTKPSKRLDRRDTRLEELKKWSGTMCDSCGVKIHFLNRKTCYHCQLHFCPPCIQPNTRSPLVCRRCTVFTSPIIERAQLQGLKPLDLKHYVTHHHIETSLNPAREELIEIILSKQAQTLVSRANMAIKQLTGAPPGTNFMNFDALQFQPHSSAYSSAGAGGSLYSGTNEKTGDSVDGTERGGIGATFLDENLRIRKKVKKSVDFAHVTNIDELDNEEDIDELSVKQLKIILQKNCINYKGCVEKTELLAKVKTLWRAKEEDKKLEAKINETGDINAENEFLCKVCMDAPVDCVLLECGHMLTCVRCGRQLAECPVCRQYVSRVVHAFKV